MTPLSEEILLLNHLDMVVLEHLADGALLLRGRAPGWFERICPNLRSREFRTELVSAAPFLDQFLLQAEESWFSGQGRLHSGYWVQQDIDANERHIEAWAVQTEARQFLVLRLLGAEFDETRHALEEFRTSSLAREIHNAKLGAKTEGYRDSDVSWILLLSLLVAMLLLMFQGFGVGHFHLEQPAIIAVGVTAFACVIGLLFVAVARGKISSVERRR